MYRTVLAEGQHNDLIALLNRDLLIGQWPVLRILINRTIRDVWEAAFSELASTRPAAGARGCSPPGLTAQRAPAAHDTLSCSGRYQPRAG